MKKSSVLTVPATSINRPGSISREPRKASSASTLCGARGASVAIARRLPCCLVCCRPFLHFLKGRRVVTDEFRPRHKRRVLQGIAVRVLFGLRRDFPGDKVFPVFG